MSTIYKKTNSLHLEDYYTEIYIYNISFFCKKKQNNNNKSHNTHTDILKNIISIKKKNKQTIAEEGT